MIGWSSVICWQSRSSNGRRSKGVFSSAKITLTINGNDLVVTVGVSDLTDALVATAVSEAINSTDALDGTVAIGTTDATSNVGGQSIPEFTEFEATVSGVVVTIDSACGTMGGTSCSAAAQRNSRLIRSPLSLT